MLQLSNSPLKATKMSEYYLAELDREFNHQIEEARELQAYLKVVHNKRLRASQKIEAIDEPVQPVTTVTVKETWANNVKHCLERFSATLSVNAIPAR